jgi:site-specific DNA recombinase
LRACDSTVFLAHATNSTSSAPQVTEIDRAVARWHVLRVENNTLDLVEVQPKQLVIRLTEEPKATNRKKTRANGALHVPWQRIQSTRRREILLPEGMPPQHARPIRSETRATLVAAIARGRRWLDELITEPIVTTESIAKRADCSIRKVNMTISLAFLAPDLVKAAIDGRLPHGMGVARLTDLPPEWFRQHELLHLPSH